MPHPKRSRTGFSERGGAAYAAQKPQRVAARKRQLEIPVTNAQRELIARAAALAGTSAAEFMINCIETAARKLTSGYEPVVLDPKYAASFEKSLLKPPPPNKALRDAARRYRSRLKT